MNSFQIEEIERSSQEYLITLKDISSVQKEVIKQHEQIQQIMTERVIAWENIHDKRSKLK